MIDARDCINAGQGHMIVIIVREVLRSSVEYIHVDEDVYWQPAAAVDALPSETPCRFR